MGMGVAMKEHIMQAVDWSKYDLQTWLRQFGSWQGSARNNYGRGENPIYTAMKQAVKKLKKSDREKIIAQYFLDAEYEEKSRRSKYSCQITDDEARAVQKLVLDIIKGTDSEILLDWMHIVISRYFNQKSWSEIAQSNELTVHEARQDVKMGLAALHCRYSFIRYEKSQDA